MQRQEASPPGAPLPGAPAEAGPHGPVPTHARPAGDAAARRPVAPPLAPPAPAASPADVFLEQLDREPPTTVQPLPPVFRPLAAVVAGTTDVRVATGPGVQRALGDVGKQAATMGSTIHLASAPADTARDVAVVGHELVHVAAPSARPRFFGGHPDAEERSAERVAAAAGGTAGLRVGGGASAAGRAVHGIVQRAVDTALRRRPPAGPADPPPPTVQLDPAESVDLAPRQDRKEEAGNEQDQGKKAAEEDKGCGAAAHAGCNRHADEAATGKEGRSEALDVDRVIEAIEERVLAELERRGGRMVEVI